MKQAHSNSFDLLHNAYDSEGFYGMSFLYIILNININIVFGFLTGRMIFLKQPDSLLTNVKLFIQLLPISFYETGEFLLFILPPTELLTANYEN
jgi:hypothetical protein